MRLNAMNKKKLHELKCRFLESRRYAGKKEKLLEAAVSPFLDDPDIHKLLEIRQLLLDVGPCRIYMKVTDLISRFAGAGNEIDIPDVLDEESRKTISSTAYEYRLAESAAEALEIRMRKYVKRIMDRNDGYRDCEYMADIIGELPGCMLRYQMMKSRHKRLEFNGGLR